MERYTPAGWEERSRWLTAVEGRTADRHAVKGALHDVEPWELLSQAEVERRLEKFLTTPENELP